jgi:hypothetical protein
MSTETIRLVATCIGYGMMTIGGLLALGYVVHENSK